MSLKRSCQVALSVSQEDLIKVARLSYGALLGSGFNDARFAGSCRPQEEHRTDRLVGRIHARWFHDVPNNPEANRSA
jgi:hypothetical protein